MRNVRYFENVMFGLDFVLECEIEWMLNFFRVFWRLNEEKSKSDLWVWFVVFYYVLLWLLIIINNIIIIIRLYVNIY